MKDIALNDKFISTIVNCFRDDGRKWLQDLEDILQRCRDKWQITSLEPVEELSYNLVCRVDTEQYGKAILKVGVPSPEFAMEAKALTYYQEKDICELYDYSEELTAMLLERISGSDDLRTVSSFEERIETAAAMIADLPVVLTAEEAIQFPAFGDWIRRAFPLIRKGPMADPQFCSYMDRAERILKELEMDGPVNLLLHGDLHHMNMLRDKERFRPIDPKGVTGPLLLNAPRFIENEIALFPRNNKELEQDLMYMLKKIAARMNSSAAELFQCLYLDQILSTAWFMEEERWSDELKKALELCHFLEQYRNKFFASCL